MQNLLQPHFIDRVLYYVTFPIQKQAVKGRKWNFNLKPVYSVNILNFSFSENPDDDTRYHHHVQLIDTETGRVIYDKLSLLFIELPDFKKPENELKTNYERWLYVLKHLSNLQKVPETLKKDKIFRKLFIEAKLANMTSEELDKYDLSLKNYRNMYTVKDIVKDWRNEVVAVRKEYTAAKNEVVAVRKEYAAIKNEVAAAKNEVVERDAKISTQAARIAELEHQLGLN